MPTGVAVYASMEMEGFGLPLRPPLPSSPTVWSVIMESPADLRDIPLGTVMHVKAFLPPDPKISAVPVLPTDNRLKKYGNAGTGVAPAENHVYLLEDEPSHCKRLGLVWKLQQVDMKEKAGTIIARREAQAGKGKVLSETFSVDATTRFWRGRERLGITDLMDEKTWPKNGKKDLNDERVCSSRHIGGNPPRGGVFKRFHVKDIWLDELAMQRATSDTERNPQGIHQEPLDAGLGGPGGIRKVRAGQSSPLPYSEGWTTPCMPISRKDKRPCLPPRKTP